MLRLGPILITNVTDDPTNKGPSSVPRRRKYPGLGKRSWMGRDPGLGRKSWPKSMRGQQRCRGGRPQKPQELFWGRHIEQSAKLRGESETVEELLDKLEESERRGELETFEELLIKLEA